jgi:hypothetical protein
VEVKIGVQYSPRELVLDSDQAPEEVAQLVTAAIDGGGVLNLVDEKGRRILVPVDKLAYVEIGEALERRVGFGAM